MNDKHTPEPWQTWPSIHNGNSYIVPVPYSGRGSIAHCDSHEIARRIVACVNACAGISDEALDLFAKYQGLPALDEMLVEIRALNKQRDELRTELAEAKKLIEQLAEALDELHYSNSTEVAETKYFDALDAVNAFKERNV